MGSVPSLNEFQNHLDSILFSKEKDKFIGKIEEELVKPEPDPERVKKILNSLSSETQSGVVAKLAKLLPFAQKYIYSLFGVEKYTNIALLDEKVCERCLDMDERAFPVKDMTPGKNAPSFHPYCRCFTVPFEEDDSEKVDFQGRPVTKNNASFDPYAVDGKGRTNIQRMKEGKAPIGYDGKSVELHHLDQTNDGPLAEMEFSDHRPYYSALHSNTGQSPSLINRSQAGTFRRSYWKWRAKDFEEGEN